MTIQLDKRFRKRAAGTFGRYQFEVGILKDGPHKEPLNGKPGLKGQDVLKNFAGGPARKVSRRAHQTISAVSKAFRKRVGFNYLTAPFSKSTHAASGGEHAFSYGNTDIRRFTNEFFKLAFGRSQKKRCENLLQAVVRNPILRGDYGSNTPLTQRIKGFDRFGIDTAQLFKAITAVAKVKTSIFGRYK